MIPATDTTVSAENDTANYATPPELRDAAALADGLNNLKRQADATGVGLQFDNIDLYDTMGNLLAVLVWRQEADSYALRVGS